MSGSMARFKRSEADSGPAEEPREQQENEQQQALMRGRMLHGGGGVEVLHLQQQHQPMGMTTRSGLVLGGWPHPGQPLQLETHDRRDDSSMMMAHSPGGLEDTPATVDAGGGWSEVFDAEDFMEEADPSRNSRDMDLSSSVDSDSKEELFRKMLTESQAVHAHAHAQAQAQAHHAAQAAGSGPSLAFGGHGHHPHAGALDMAGLPPGHAHSHRVTSPEEQQAAGQSALFASSPPQDPSSFVLSEMAAALPDTIPPGSQATPRSTQRTKFTRVQELRAAEEVVQRAEERIPHATLAQRANSPSGTFGMQNPGAYDPSYGSGGAR